MYLKRKIVVIITVLSILISLSQVAFKFLWPIYLSHKYDFDIGDASSVGIIGGADGPTAIYVATSQSGNFVPLIPVITSILGVIYLLKTNRKK